MKSTPTPSTLLDLTTSFTETRCLEDTEGRIRKPCAVENQWTETRAFARPESCGLSQEQLAEIRAIIRRECLRNVECK
jgi:hypothetical protein